MFKISICTCRECNNVRHFDGEKLAYSNGYIPKYNFKEYSWDASGVPVVMRPETCNVCHSSCFVCELVSKIDRGKVVKCNKCKYRFICMSN